MSADETFLSLHPSISPCSLPLRQQSSAKSCLFLSTSIPHFAIILLMPAHSARADSVCVRVCMTGRCCGRDQLQPQATHTHKYTHTLTQSTHIWLTWFVLDSDSVDLPRCCTVWGVQMFLCDWFNWSLLPITSRFPKAKFIESYISSDVNYVKTSTCGGKWSDMDFSSGTMLSSETFGIVRPVKSWGSHVMF